jgi:hypothetical protein
VVVINKILFHLVDRSTDPNTFYIFHIHIHTTTLTAREKDLWYLISQIRTKFLLDNARLQ